MRRSSHRVRDGNPDWLGGSLLRPGLGAGTQSSQCEGDSLATVSLGRDRLILLPDRDPAGADGGCSVHDRSLAVGTTSS